LTLPDIYEDLGLPKQKSIVRIDQPERGNHGWNVRVCWQHQMYSRWHPDSAYGRDPVASYWAAVETRDEIEAGLGKPRTERYVNGSASGVTRRVKGGRDVVEFSWMAQPGVRKKSSVSVHVYGEEGAYRRAEQLRREKWLESVMSEEAVSKRSETRRKLRRTLEKAKSIRAKKGR
jgi:hypothetical protein